MLAFRRFWFAAAVVAGLYCLPAQLLPAAAAPPARDMSQDERQAILTGADLERSRRWLDAIDHYKDCSEQWPESPEIEYGLRRAKIHFKVDRRYTDKSYASRLLTVPRDEAYALLDEIIGKINRYYVEELSTSFFVAHGTESLFLALNNEKFLTANSLRGDDPRVAEFRSLLKTQYWNRPVGSTAGARGTVSEVARLAQQRLGLSENVVVMEYVFGGCNALDEFSGYLTPGKLDELYNNIHGEFVGLGIEMRAEAGKGVLLVNVIPESPAQEGGLESGDFVTSIGGHDCREMTTDEAANLLGGLTGSQVKLEWLQSTTGLARTNIFTRRSVTVKAIPTVCMLDSAAGIGYVRMAGFQDSTVKELDAALVSLRDQGMKSLVWDLRGNPGGLLPAAVEVLDRFIGEGTLVTTRGRTQDQNWRYSANRQGTWDVPLIVLIDGNSASASELCAGSIHDHDRGLLVGRKTYGKWSVQSIFQAGAGTGLKVTTAKFYSPNDGWYGGVGLEPDFTVERDAEAPLKYSPADLLTDPDVRKAMELLGNPLFSQRS